MASNKNETTKFTKQQFLQSAKFEGNRDLLNALLSDNETYTLEQVDALLDEFLKKEAL